jgi:predicted transcriptional regulator
MGTGSTPSAFGEWLMATLESKELTAGDFAKKMDLSPGMVSRYMRNPMPPRRRWQQIIDVLELTEAEIEAARKTCDTDGNRGLTAQITSHEFMLQRRRAVELGELSYRSLIALLKEQGWQYELGDQDALVPYFLRVFHANNEQGPAASVIINIGQRRFNERRMTETAMAQSAITPGVLGILFLYPFPRPDLYLQKTAEQMKLELPTDNLPEAVEPQIVHFGNLLKTLKQLLPDSKSQKQ